MKDHTLRIPLVISIIISLLFAVGCATSLTAAEPTATEPPQAQIKLTVSGSGGTTTILEAVKPAFEADTPGYTLEILTGTGTGGGVEGVATGVLDVAAMARPPKDEELETSPSLQYLEFGRTGQAVFVSSDVGELSLTSDQVRAIFFGEVDNWSEVNGPDGQVFVFVRDEGDSSTAALREAIFDDTPFHETAQVMKSQGDMIAAVEGTPYSVGFGTWPAVLASHANVQATALDGLPPGSADYPITGVLGLGYLEENQDAVQPLLDWLLSDAGRAALLELDVIVAQ